MPRDVQSIRLQPDSVVEALMELRFTATDLADIIPFKLSTFPLAKSFQTERLPLADMPRPMRVMDPTLAVSPILQQKSPDGSRIAKLGEQVFSWHALGVYPGWTTFQPEIAQTINFAYETIAGLKATRIGLRYVNAFSAETHAISTANDLALDILIAGERLSAPFNLNYSKSAPSMVALVKLATPEFVQGAPAATTLLMDIDVSLAPDSLCGDANQIVDWLEQAHVFLKTEFFAMLTEPLIDKLAAQAG